MLQSLGRFLGDCLMQNKMKDNKQMKLNSKGVAFLL